MRKICFLLLCMCLIFPASAERVELPLDFSAGMPLQKKAFLSENEYEDPTIHVVWESGRAPGDMLGCEYWIARITISSPLQLRTLSAGGFDSAATNYGYKLAKRANAVLAIDGDYYFYTGKGFILRQGIEYQNILDGTRDVLLIDEDGDFHIVRNAEQGSVSAEVNGKAVWNAFYFGPALVVDGERVKNPTGDNMAENKPRQRMCLAQTGPLEYMVICCAGPARGSDGMTLDAFSRLVAEQNVLNAYNLDGGDSTMLIFNGEKVNDKSNQSSRTVSDIIYFASAWKAEE